MGTGSETNSKAAGLAQKTRVPTANRRAKAAATKPEAPSKSLADETSEVSAGGTEGCECEHSSQLLR